MSRAPRFAEAALLPHPASPAGAARSIVVRLRREPQRLALCYRVSADVARLRIPPTGRAARVDGLWRHTCFELFVAVKGSTPYQEFNFSPSGDWAAYAFADYREGAGPLECAPPAIELRSSESALELGATLAYAPSGPVRVGLSAVVEDTEGLLSYWALHHPSLRPDFHHAASFVLELDEIRH